MLVENQIALIGSLPPWTRESPPSNPRRFWAGASHGGRSPTSRRLSRFFKTVDKFHGRSERGVRQELCAHFNLIAMARLFSNHGDGILDEMDESDRPRMKTSFTNALAMLALNLEEMIL